MSEQDTNEVRREAFRAASAAVDYFLEQVGDPIPDELSKLGAASWDRFRSELARVVDLNLEMVRDAFGLYETLVEPDSFTTDRRGAKLVLGPGMPGSGASAILWLHNFDEDPISGVDLIGSRLSSRYGERIDDPHWSFTHSNPFVPARSAVPVLVEVAIPPGTTGGSYEGTISSKGGNGETIDVRLEVTAIEPIPHDSW
ncbi:MAG TPA: hypothetical protein VF148_10435 [Acidimicrobiia bacterium]